MSIGLLLAAIVVIGVNMRVTITGVGPLLEQMSASTGESVALLSSLTSVPVVLWAVLSSFAHTLSHRFGMNRIVLCALVVLTLGTLIRSLPGPEFSLWFGTALVGVALAIANVLLPAVVKRSFGRHVALVTSMYTALFAGCGALASGVVVPISHAVEPNGGDTGWRFALVAVAATLPIAIVLWLLHMRRFGTDTGRRIERGSARGPSVWGDPVAWLVGLYMGAQAIMFYVMITWLAPYARSLGHSEVLAGYDVMIFQMVGVLGSVLLPFTMRGRTERWVPAMLPVFSLIGVSGLLLAPGGIFLLDLADRAVQRRVDRVFADADGDPCPRPPHRVRALRHGPVRRVSHRRRGTGHLRRSARADRGLDRITAVPAGLVRRASRDRNRGRPRSLRLRPSAREAELFVILQLSIYTHDMTALTPSSFWILTVLASGRRHGYEIMREATEASEGSVSLKVATLYAALERLERDGLLIADGEEVVAGRNRRYYRLTDAGATRLAQEVELLERSAKAARKRLPSGAVTKGAAWA